MTIQARGSDPTARPKPLLLPLVGLSALTGGLGSLPRGWAAPLRPSTPQSSA